MKVTVERIYFNYYQSDINLFGTHPEFGMNVMPQDISRFPVAPYNSVAYAMDATEGKALKIHCLLKGPIEGDVKIRAVDPFSTLDEALTFLNKHGIKAGKEDHLDRLLGDVQERFVSFDANGNSIGLKFKYEQEYSGLVELELSGTDIHSRGVYASWQMWKWEFSSDSGKNWQPVSGLVDGCISVHRVFATKSIASWPWTSYDEEVRENAGHSYFISRPPYTGALEWACKWAEGETTEQGIATKITEHINTCGKFKYASSTQSNYTSIYSLVFDCGRFIDRLNGKFGRGPNVNCVDCTHMVLSLSNALGCNLVSGKIKNENGSLEFMLNPVFVIGYDDPGAFTKFYYHQVAAGLDGEDQSSARIYDACVRFGEKIYHKLDAAAPQDQKELMESLAVKDGHPVDIPLGEDAFSFGYLSILVKAVKQASQENLQLNEGDSELWSVSSFNFY